MPVLEAIPDVQKLGDAMVPYMVGILFGVIPCERSSESEETHWYKAVLSLGAKTGWQSMRRITVQEEMKFL